MTKFFLFPVLAILALPAHPVAQEEAPYDSLIRYDRIGYDVEAADGDSISVYYKESGRPFENIKLWGLSACDVDPCMSEAKEALSALMGDASMLVCEWVRDFEGTISLMKCSVDGKDLGVEMARAGYVRDVWTEECSEYGMEVGEATEEARAAKRGMWVNEGRVEE